MVLNYASWGIGGCDWVTQHNSASGTIEETYQNEYGNDFDLMRELPNIKQMVLQLTYLNLYDG